MLDNLWRELNKNPDDMYFPDYNGIKIKCTTRYNDFPLFLFNTSSDGPTYTKIDRLIEKYFCLFTNII